MNVVVDVVGWLVVFVFVFCFVVCVFYVFTRSDFPIRVGFSDEKAMRGSWTMFLRLVFGHVSHAPLW